MNCLPKAFATVLGVDVNDIYDYCGHEVIWPHLPSPHKFQGFHPQELIDYAHIKHGVSVLTIERFPSLVREEGEVPFRVLTDPGRWISWLCRCRGVMINNTHAQAYSIGGEQLERSTIFFAFVI